MADAAAAAVVSYGLAYRHFANKEALFQALLEESLQASAAAFARFQERPGTPGEHLTTRITALVEGRRSHPERSQLLAHVLGAGATPPEVRTQAFQVGRAFQALLRLLVVEGQALGEVRTADPNQLITDRHGDARWHEQVAGHQPRPVSPPFPRGPDHSEHAHAGGMSQGGAALKPLNAQEAKE